MEYTLNCKVTEGVCWYGGLRDYNTTISVDLSKEEFELLKAIIAKEGEFQVSFDETKEKTEISKKIQEAAKDFLRYVVNYDGCYYGIFFEGVDLKSLQEMMKEDIERGYNSPLIDSNEFDCDWIHWLDEQNKNLSYLERAQYLEKRFGFEFEPDMIADMDICCTLPDEIVE